MNFDVSPNMINLPGKTIFRCDRRNNVNYYDTRPTAGGACIYIDNKYANFTEIVLPFTRVTLDFEVLTLITTRPDHRHFITICVYKPPKGDILKCIEFLKTILADNIVKRKEIWILGDFNTDLLKRDEHKTVSLLSFAKKAGLSQLIREVTRPNRNGGSCIDLIFTNCMLVQESGILPDMISDHYTVFAVRKKKREDKRVKVEYVRDYSKFNKNVFCQALDNLDWEPFDIEMNPEKQWEIIYDHVIEILSIMCPLKVVHTRLSRKKWLTKEIYSLIRDRKILVKQYFREKLPILLKYIRKARNVINAKVEKAKSEYIRNLLGSTKKEPKKFLRNIKNLIDGDKVDTEHVIFKNPLTGVEVPDNDVPNFLNEYFANISDRVCDPLLSKVYIPGDIRPTSLFFVPPEQYEIMIYAEEIDINSLGGINGINTMICKCLILHMPAKFRLMFSNSMFTGYFPFS